MLTGHTAFLETNIAADAQFTIINNCGAIDSVSGEKASPTNEKSGMMAQGAKTPPPPPPRWTKPNPGMAAGQGPASVPTPVTFSTAEAQVLSVRTFSTVAVSIFSIVPLAPNGLIDESITEFKFITLK